MKEEQIRELLHQALETEMGGVEVYTTALRCVLNEELKKIGLNPEQETPGREVVRHIGRSLVKAMEQGPPSEPHEQNKSAIA